MKKLAVVIVNYNVAFFLEQCLQSVLKAAQHVDCEVFVVDNNSVDDSVALVKERFPSVHLIANEHNVGFSKANNQAIKLSRSEYVLLLNPDTLVEEDTFSKVCAFMDEHPDAGGLGVRMIDGKGRFLPESKRGLPTPAVAFYKIFGLARLFPRSHRFGSYHLSYLSETETHAVDVLSGAFMLLRKEALDRVGLLDETFFMYGEDIDLSYRLVLGGYRNYYFPETQIIHYKGESTKKGSLNYVFVFYKAMVIFADKHFKKKGAAWFSLAIHSAIWLRASAAVVHRLITSLALPLFDAASIWGLWHLGAWGYENLTQKTLSDPLTAIAFPLIALLWPAYLWASGAYDRPFRMSRLMRINLSAAVLLLVLYSLLPESMRFSRLMILWGSALNALYYGASRLVFQWLKWGMYGRYKSSKRFLIVGDHSEQERLGHLLQSISGVQAEVCTLLPDRIDALEDMVRIERIDEVVFSGRDLSVGSIIALMSTITQSNIDFKIAPPNSDFVIGSHSIDSQGDLYLVSHNGINTPHSRRRKRAFDFSLALLMIALLPLTLWIWRRRRGFIKQLFWVWLGEWTWVGFNPSYLATLRQSTLKKSVFYRAPESISAEEIHALNEAYSKSYHWLDDVRVVVREKLIVNS